MFYLKRIVFSIFSFILFILMIILRPIVSLIHPAQQGWKTSKDEPHILKSEENTNKGAIRYYLARKEFATLLIFLGLLCLLTFYTPTILLVGSYLYSIF